MAVSIFSGCDDSCGWIAASIAALSYGSYGVPIKAACAKVGDVDPLVLQVSISSHLYCHGRVHFSFLTTLSPSVIHLKSYKTFVFFLSCWSVLLLGT